MTRARIIQVTAYTIAVVQIILGLAYFFVPSRFNAALGLSKAPDWTAWPLQESGARFLAFGFGMILVARQPRRHYGWIQAMIFVQALDWLATVADVARGTVTLGQVGAAAFLPLLFIAGLGVGYPRAGREERPSVEARAGVGASTG